MEKILKFFKLPPLNERNSLAYAYAGSFGIFVLIAIIADIIILIKLTCPMVNQAWFLVISAIKPKQLR